MILIALGSNVGNRAAWLQRACEAMEVQGIRLLQISQPIETPALLADGAPPEWNMPFMNQVVRVQTSLTPQALLAALKAIETALGRIDRGRWGPREIDLDLLAYDAQVFADDALTLPHAQLHRRDFVLRPLREIVPNWRHPTLGKTPAEMLAVL